ncbi:hypothetical protein [Frankia sp. R82]|uniref:hypothetical protein n=1 Tax=Frankia sp. R82 TaxID=2950553 RepID=UPI0020440D29|nr:hypothetical protein [Frankia sp. R82]MCM3883076.1 hypothetical protein [Frankia sp. R82]
MSRPKASLRAEQDDLRSRMRDRGRTHQEIAVEFARRYRYRPRAAHRHAFGWTLTQAADRINAYAAEHGLDPAGKAPMSEPKLSELENFPRSRVRRLMPQTLALLAGVYGTEVHALLDLDDHDHLSPSDRLLLASMGASLRAPSTPAPPQPALAGPLNPAPPAADRSPDRPAHTPALDPVTWPVQAAGPQESVEERLRHVRDQPRSVDLVTIALLRQRVEDLDARYDRTPPTELLPEAGQMLTLASFLRSQSPTMRLHRELLTAEAEAAILMGQLIWDASQRRDHHQAHTYLGRAAAAGRELRNPILEGFALLRSTIVALYGERDPQSALDLAGRCMTVTAGSSDALTGLATLHAAEAYAMQRSTTGCEELLGQAEHLLGSATTADEASYLYSPSHIPRIAGSCYLALGQPKKAEDLLTRAYSHSRNPAKADAIVLGNLALAHIRQRKPDEAAHAFHQALDVVTRTWGGGGITMAFTISRELRPWRHMPAVADACDRLLDVMASPAHTAS